MDYSTALLGTHIVNRLRARVAAPVVIIGRDSFLRADLAAVECFNFMAAYHLSTAIAALKVENTRDLFRTVEPEQLARPNVGAFAFAVLGACFEVKGVGTLDAWVEHSRAKGERVTTFATMKAKIQKQTSATTQKPKPRRNKTHAQR
jgi:hypothetical protein